MDKRIEPKHVQKVYVGYEPHQWRFRTTAEAYDWITCQDGYKDKTTHYQLYCHYSGRVKFINKSP